MSQIAYDVVIIGGGPAGSTVGTLLRKYNPRLNVLILEREKFPRDHVGESQLPLIGHVLDEMGVWDKVERANFPIKVGATYRWGQTDELWDFEFLSQGQLKDEPRPAKFVGQRTETAFQVDRAKYDDILLNHARELGCRVKQETAVREVLHEGDRVTGLVLETGETVTARHYVDCSGHSGILRRAMGVHTQPQTNLQNIAIWDYWQNAEWAVNIGVGGTRVQVMSLGYGWIWFIPLGPTRTSIGLIVPAEYFKNSGKKPAELYAEALASEPRISGLLKKATSEGKLTTTKDWSFVADRLTGENWFLAGECAGFADPILAAGMTLAHMGAKEVAYAILAIDRRDYDENWIRTRYCESHRGHIMQHIKFADFWYTHNGVFTDLQEHAKNIAGDAGLNLSNAEAWRWLGTGGFIDGNQATTGTGGYSLTATKHITSRFTGEKAFNSIDGKTHFALDIEGTEKGWGADHSHGYILRHRILRREGKNLPLKGVPGMLVNALKGGELSYAQLNEAINEWLGQNAQSEMHYQFLRGMTYDTLEALVTDGWIKARTEPGFPAIPAYNFEADAFVHPNRDLAAAG